MKEVVPSIREIYEQINVQKQKYGKFKKCELHLHTPASYDYRLFAEKEYQTLTISDIYEQCLSSGFLNKETIELLKANEASFSGQEYSEQITNTPIENYKEYLSYMLIAHKLYSENIEVVMVCDHNTFRGYKKIKFCVEEYYRTRIKGNKNNKRQCIIVFAGIEISCSDKQHLIAIFEEKMLDKANSYLHDILLSEEEGCYQDSRTLIEKLSSSEFNAICYLAHLNSSTYAGSGAYNSMLFNSQKLELIGTKKLEAIEDIKRRILGFKVQDINRFQFLLEGDSHEIDTIGIRSTWIKFEKANFSSLRKAVQNRKICIRVTEPNVNERYIKGIAIIPGKEGFLRNLANTPQYQQGLFIPFSEDLNCIIGGRGTGKSTILNMIEVMLTRECSDYDKLEFISNHTSIYAVICLDEIEYVLHFLPQKVNKDKKYYFDKSQSFYNVISRGSKIILGDNWLKLYRYDNQEFTALDVNSTKNILAKIFRRSYNINYIVSKINDGEITQFIREVVTYGMYHEPIEKYTTLLRLEKDKSFNKRVRESLPEIIEVIANKSETINKYICGFNQQNNNLIEIIYSPCEGEISYINQLLNEFRGYTHIAGTYFTPQYCQTYIVETIKQIGYLQFLNLLMNKQFGKLDKINSIKKYEDYSDISYKNVEANLRHVDDSNKNNIFMYMKKIIESNRRRLEQTIFECFKVTDEFTIKFNVNSKETVRNEPCQMKDIKELSLGQKVVAILTFVFNFGLYCGDTTPLIIDQPEDNLDNQYIYKNLVSSLRKIKTNRQVIIVTHSSTIVTNADAEQVIVMASNNQNGWLEARGYPSDPKIIKHILNYLEGGQDSFKHKSGIYKLFISGLQ